MIRPATKQNIPKLEDVPDLYDKSSPHYPLNISYDAVASNIYSDSALQQLILHNGDKNIYLQIANLLEQAQDKNGAFDYSGTLDKASALRSIEGIISSETPSAENEFASYGDLMKNFYPRKEYKYIFDNSKFIITGSKGSGKTALFKVLNCPEYAQALANYIGITEKEVTSTKWLIGLDAGKDFPSKANFRAIGATQNPEYFMLYWKILAIRTLKETIQHYRINTYDYLQDIISCEYRQIIKYIQQYPNMNEELSELLGEMNRRLALDCQEIIITYDSLDTCIDKEFRGRLLSELISFWAENNLRYTNLRAKIFLRNDIFKNEILLTDKIKLNNYRSNIEWNYDYLLAMLWKRIIEADSSLKSLIKNALEKEGYSLAESKLVGVIPRPSEETNKIILDTLVGEKMGKGNKAYTYNWILYRLADTNNKIVPRSILKLFSVAARLERNGLESSKKETSKLLNPKSLENAVEEVSEYKITDMGEEYIEYQPLFYNLKNYCSIFPADEENFHHALLQCGIKQENLKTVIDHLIEIGVLKEYQRKKEDPIRYHIPDIYLKGMKLKRKGFR